MTRPFFAPRSSRWVPGNHFELLENGEEFFPRVFDAIANARHEVMLETFILFEDKIGQQLHAALLGAAQRAGKCMCWWTALARPTCLNSSSAVWWPPGCISAFLTRGGAFWASG